MPLFKTSDNAGQWFVFRKGDDIQFKVRRIPGGKAREIAFNAGTRLRQVGRKGTTVDLEKEFEIRLAQATWALLDSKNADVELGDAKGAEEYSRVLGREVKPGDLVRLDGQLEANEALKRLVLGDWVRGLDFVLESAAKMGAKSDEEEEEARGN